jgi:cardiolipin synthase A/B
MYMKFFIILFLALSLGCSKASNSVGVDNGNNSGQQTEEDDLIVFFGPNPKAHVEFVNLINSAQKTINLAMFRITENSDAQALMAAAKRQVKVRVILDREATQASTAVQKIATDLRNAGAEVKESTTGFSITHEKAMTVDSSKAIISTINLTKGFATTRDVGIQTEDRSVITEFNAVFEADWLNADTGGTTTPTLTSDKLLWSPNNSTQKLVALIQESQTTIDLQVENFTNNSISQALISAAARKVKIRVLTPLCSLNPNPLLNIPTLRKLSIDNIQVKVMPNPSTAAAPYIHAKSMTVDQTKSYVGSVNFSNNSLNSAREVGIIFKNKAVSGSIKTEYDKDWLQAIPLPSNPQPSDCL